MWKTLALKLILFTGGFGLCWLVLTQLMPISITVSPTVGITLFDCLGHRMFFKSLFSGMSGLIFSFIPTLREVHCNNKKTAD